jgi:hypothetical protein
MLKMPRDLGAQYSPLYFLASVGAGGLVVTFFMYLMFWVPHTGRPVPIFEDIVAYSSSASLIGQIMVAVAMIGIAVFAFMNLRMLFWNLSEYKKFKQTDAFASHQASNAQSQILALPLALAMSVNASFILGLVFVPQLWSVIEYLFPLALIAFLLIGVLAFNMMAKFMGRVLVSGGFSCSANNSFAQMLPAFAFAMVGVGLSAPSAMSGSATVVGVSLILSTFFLVTSAILGFMAMLFGMRSMMEHGAAPESAPTLLIVVPLLTVLGILMLRQDHGLHTQFEVHGSGAETMMMLATFLSVQILFTLFGLMILRRQNYVQKFLNTGTGSPGSYALICPGVALSVMLQFFVNKGLVGSNLVDKYSLIYWGITALALISQVAMVWLIFKVNTQHFGGARRETLIAAE